MSVCVYISRFIDLRNDNDMFDFDDFAMEDLVTRSINPKDQQDSTIHIQCTPWLMIVYPIFPMVLLIIIPSKIPTQWLFHWGYTPFSDIPIYCTKNSFLLGVTKFHGSLPLLSGFRCSLLHRTSLGHEDGSFFGRGTEKKKGLQSTPRQKSEKNTWNTYMINDLGLFQSCMTMPCWPLFTLLAK